MKHEDEIPRQTRRNRMIHERVHDPYKTRLKLPEPTVCPQCGAVFHEGRWHWAPRPSPAHEELCQACHQKFKPGLPSMGITRFPIYPKRDGTLTPP